MILGWIWSNGTIYASPHRVATLASCDTPTTVKGLRSFIGAYKVLARVISNCAELLSPLDDIVAGKQSQDKLKWSDISRKAFVDAQASLSSMYTTKNGKPRLAAFFSAKLRKRQVSWIPCEIEALSIAADIKHLNPYIIQSHHKTCILTDSKPCVQAFEKLCRGEFSASPRMSTFLSSVSRYQATVRHLAGSANVPSYFASRNASDCDSQSCQICTFVSKLEDSVVRRASTQEIISGLAAAPFTSRSAWHVTQSECPDLRRTHAHLTQGTRPSKKLPNIRDVKQYLNIVTIAKDGLLVVRREEPLSPARDCIIVPRQVLDGLLSALHIRLDHPKCHQSKAVAHRYFYAICMDKAIERISKACHLCASLQTIPHSLKEQSTCEPPTASGISFAADVIKRERQNIFVLRETVTSYTAACFIDNEQRCSLRSALIRLCVDLRPLDVPLAVIRTDPAPEFVALSKDDLLHQHRMCMEVGRVKNPNKYPVAEKAVQELEDEILRQDPAHGSVSDLTLCLAVARLNSRIRSNGLSARELWCQRDQFTNSQLPISDLEVITSQHKRRKIKHPYSEKAKTPSCRGPGVVLVDVGDLVNLHIDRNKSRARDRYLVVSVDDN